MAKTKRNKKNVSDATRKRKRPEGERTNPFEVKINKQKHNILGKKVTKHEKGMPGVSRSRAIKKRKATLLQEYQKRGKAGKMTDRRIGADNPDISEEDKMLKRFALEKLKGHDKPDLFNLNEEEEEELTHYGQSLSEIEKFDRPHEDSDDEDKIDSDIVAEEHFGGGILTKRKDSAPGSQSWQERMEQLISQTKKDRHERQTDQEKQQHVTDKLDKEWKEMNHLVTQRGGQKREDAAAEASKPAAGDHDDYDMILGELRFEATVVPTNRLKTEEEIAQEEKERLEQLEADRMRRMKGLETKDTTKHKSADDLDDGFVLDSDHTDDRFHLSYKDGKMLTNEDESEAKEESEEKNDDGEDGEDSEEDEEEEEGSEEESGDNEEADDPLGHTSDLESEEDDDGDDDDNNEEDSSKEKGKSNTASPKKQEAESAEEKPKDFKEVLKERKQIMEDARKELPYTFTAPESTEDMHELLNEHSDSDQLIIIERLIKCHHPSLAEGNKAKLELLFGLLLEYAGDMCLKPHPRLSLVDKLTLPLYQLCQISPLSAGQTTLQLVIQKQADFDQGKKRWPGLDVLMFLKLIPVLLPTSDFKHAVVTPAMMFMSQILSQCPVISLTDVASGLFMCGLFLEYVNRSKRYVPEAINFLRGVMFLGCQKNPQKIEPVIPPFRPVGKNIDLMVLEKKQRDMTVSPLKFSECQSTQQSDKNTDEFRVCAMCQCMRLAVKFGNLYQELPAVTEIFEPVLKQATKLAFDSYPSALQSDFKELEDLIIKERVRHPITMQKKKPQPLRQLDPVIDDVCDGKKKRSGTREFQEKQKLLHKYRKERKGAMREIRRDALFIAKQKMQDQLQSDADRKRKVKDILGQLANQQGDINALKRLKRKM